MLRITVEIAPGGDFTRAKKVAEARICNLGTQPAPFELGDYHAFFEADEVPDDAARGVLDRPAFYPDQARKVEHLVSSAYTYDYPRLKGSVWDLIADLLSKGGRGRPDA